VIHQRAVWIAAALMALLPFGASPRAGRDVQPLQNSGVELRQGDRVVFLGDSFFEREYRYGLIETAITLAHPDKGLTFRSLGWTGDTVWGEARAYFGEPADGYAELLSNVDLAAPTVVLVAYGGNESFDGAGELPAFLAQYRKLLDNLMERTPRVILFTPLPHEAASSPLPPDRIDRRSLELSEYAQAIKELAASRGLVSIDLFGVMQTAIDHESQPLFQNGMHLTEAGYAVAASAIAERTMPAAATADFQRLWHGSPSVSGGPVDPAAQAWAPLRDLVVAKNDSFFHRWRPANATYVYLNRRSRQGTTAGELPAFDPVVDRQERAITRLASELTSGAAASVSVP